MSSIGNNGNWRDVVRSLCESDLNEPGEETQAYVVYSRGKEGRRGDDKEWLEEEDE